MFPYLPYPSSGHLSSTSTTMSINRKAPTKPPLKSRKIVVLGSRSVGTTFKFSSLTVLQVKVHWRFSLLMVALTRVITQQLKIRFAKLSNGEIKSMHAKS